MPEISRFFGIVIRMYYNDHNPPHFHATCGDQEALIAIEPVALLRGELSVRTRDMVFEWAAWHRHALLVNWNRLRAAQAPTPVPPLG